MLEGLALVVVVVAALYFCALGVASLLMPDRARSFLLGFAGSPRVHYAELFIRLVVGAAFVVHAPRMFAAGAFSFSGWVVLATTACLLLLPWRWHHRFARHAVPRANRYITLIGLSSLVLGGLTLAAVIRGSAA